jgi:hypothetical protein
MRARRSRADNPIMVEVVATFELRSAYGQVRAYPVGTVAQALCELTGSKTLTVASIAPAKRLGIQVQSTSGTEIRAEHLW